MWGFLQTSFQNNTLHRAIPYKGTIVWGNAMVWTPFPAKAEKEREKKRGNYRKPACVVCLDKRWKNWVLL
jgi:hypothetical protein